MKHLLFSILFFFSLSSFSKLDTNNVILGSWKLKAIKTEASLRSFDDQIETKSKISSESLLKIEIKRDSIYIIKERYGALKDTFAYTYFLKTDTSKYSTSKFKLILQPNKSRLKGLRKWYRKSQKELSFNIIRLTNSQLTLGDVFTNNYPSNPFSTFTYITYYFEKMESNIINELSFEGKWFLTSNSHSPFEIQDTLLLTRKRVENKGKFIYQLNIKINSFKENELEFKELSRPKPKPRLVNNGVVDGIYIQSYFFSKNWLIDTNQQLISIKLNSEKMTYKYSFHNGQLLLIKNGS